MLSWLFTRSGPRLSAVFLLVVVGALSVVLLPSRAEAQAETAQGWVDVFIPSRGPDQQPLGARLTLFEAGEDGEPGEELTRLSAEEGEVTSVPVDPGCYVVSLLNGIPGSVWKKTDTVLIDFFVCVEAGERVRIDSGERWPEGIPLRHRGEVMSRSGKLVPGVVVDFFMPIAGITDEQLMDLTEADHEAVDYRGEMYVGASVITDDDGYFTQAITFGLCPVIETLTLPEGFVFDNGTRQLRRTSCPGEFVSFTVNHQPEALVGGTVRFADGSPAAGVVVDFFAANADGLRGRFLGDVETDSSGVFSRSLAAGCYVLVYIAPDGEAFVGRGRYLEIGVCVAAGEKVTDLDAHLSSPKGEALVGGTVRFGDGSPAAGVVVDFFAANADGSRSKFIGDEITSKDGRYSRVVVSGCYVLVFIAPPGTRLTPGTHDGKFLEARICVKDKATVDAELTRLAQPCEIQGEVVATPLTGPECDALLVFFEATDGPNWRDNTGWNTPTDPCTWAGLECTGGRLVTMVIARSGLSGSLPPELGQLTDLESLVLLQNSLTGPIPAELGQLSNLRTLSFESNQLSGPLPPELGQLGSVEFVSLTGNQISGPIPPELGQLGSVESLSLGWNEFSGPIPPELGQLANVRALFLGSNQLSGPIPSELGRLASVEFLSLAANQLSGPIPPELGRLATAQSLVLSDNRLSGPIPPELGQLARARTLALSKNQLSGSIPAELGRLAALRFLDLADNRLTGDITEAMTGLRAQAPLQRLSLSDGPGGNTCLTVTDPTLEPWIAGFDPEWAECDVPPVAASRARHASGPEGFDIVAGGTEMKVPSARTATNEAGVGGH